MLYDVLLCFAMFYSFEWAFEVYTDTQVVLEPRMWTCVLCIFLFAACHTPNLVSMPLPPKWNSLWILQKRYHSCVCVCVCVCVWECVCVCVCVCYHYISLIHKSMSSPKENLLVMSMNFIMCQVWSALERRLHLKATQLFLFSHHIVSILHIDTGSSSAPKVLVCL